MKEPSASFTVVGVDPALTNMGVWVIPTYPGSLMSKFVGGQTLKTSPDDHPVGRLVALRQGLKEILAGCQPNLVVLEDYVYSSPGWAADHRPAEVGGVVRTLLWDLNQRTLLVNPGQLKKFVLGKGSGKKELMLQQVYKRWGLELSDHNQADAYGLARIGQAYCTADFSGWVPVCGQHTWIQTQKDLEVIIALRKRGLLIQ